MALAITSLGSSQDVNNTTTVVLASSTPADNSIVVIWQTNGPDSASIAVSSIADGWGDSGGGTWQFPTTAAIHDQGGSPSRWLSGQFAWREIGTGAGAGTCTVTLDAASRDKTIHGVCLTGYDTTTPVAQDDVNNGTGASLVVTLGISPTSTSAVLCGIFDRSGTTPAVGTGFTAITTQQDTGDAVGALEYDLVSADTTADWTSLASSQNIAVAIEVAELAAGGGGRTTKNTDTYGLGIAAGVSRTIKTAGL